MERYFAVNINKMTDAHWKFWEMNMSTDLFINVMPMRLTDAIKDAQVINKDTIVTCVY